MQGLVDESRGGTTGSEFGVALGHGAIHLGAAIVRPGAGAGVVHQYVQAAQRGVYLGEGGIDGCAVRYVAGQREVLRRIRQQSQCGGGIFLAQVQHAHPRSFFSKTQSEGAAHTAAGAGDDGNLIGQAHGNSG